MTTAELKRLFDHVAWADSEVLQAFREAATVPPSGPGVLAHLLAAEEVWLARLERREPSIAVWPELTPEECAELAERNAARYAAYLERLTPRELEGQVHYRNSAGREFDSAVVDILLHVALHGAYHRGQLAGALRAAGSTPRPTDYIAFVRGAPAATRVPA